MKDTQAKLKTTEASKSKTVKIDKKRHHSMIEDVDANSGSPKFGSLSHLPITHTHPLRFFSTGNLSIGESIFSSRTHASTVTGCPVLSTDTTYNNQLLTSPPFGTSTMDLKAATNGINKENN